MSHRNPRVPLCPDRRLFRKSSNYALACISELLRPAIRTGAQLRAADFITPPAQWRRGLLLGASHIGDVLYRSASLLPLKAGLPDCQWHFLAEPAIAEVIQTHPALDGVLKGVLPRPGSTGFFRLARSLRKERFDAAICYDTGQYWPALLLTAHAGIPNRVGYVHKGFSGLVTHPIAFCGAQPFPGYFRELVAQLTRQRPDWSLRPVVVTTETDEREAAALWEELAFTADSPVLACFVTTRQPSGIWPQARFAEVLRLLGAHHRLQVVLCGAPGDAAALHELKQEHGLDCRIAAGRIPLRSLVAFLRRCSAVLSTDSGPRHLANAANVPVFFVRNLWFNKVEAGRYCDTEFDFAPDVELTNPDDEAAIFKSLIPEFVAQVMADHLRLPPR